MFYRLLLQAGSGGSAAGSSNGSRKSFFCLCAVSEKEVGQARLLDRHALSLDGFCRSDGGVISLHSMGHHTASPFRKSCGAHTSGDGEVKMRLKILFHARIKEKDDFSRFV